MTYLILLQDETKERKPLGDITEGEESDIVEEVHYHKALLYSSYFINVILLTCANHQSGKR
jgi:hypothetical protein